MIIPMFSLVVPTIKTHFLKDAIESVLMQSYDNYELIIVDDCSKYDVCGLVKNYDDKRIRFYRTPKNLGAKDPTRTWNAGLKFSRGKFVTILGDDDKISPNFLSEMNILTLEYPSSNLYRARLEIINERNEIKVICPYLPEYETWDEFLYNRNFFRRPHSTSEYCARRGGLLEIGGFQSMPMAWGSDDLTWLKLSIMGGIASTNKTKAFWRVHPNSISGNPKSLMEKIRIEILLCKKEREIALRETPPKVNLRLLEKAFEARFPPGPGRLLRILLNTLVRKFKI